MDKDVILILKQFEQSTYWEQFKTKREADMKALEIILDHELEDEVGMSIHTLWRKMITFVESVGEDAKAIFGDVEGGDIVIKQIELDALSRKNNVYKAVQEDFKKESSYHDLLRSQRNYIEGLLEYPKKLSEIEAAERAKEESEAALTELETIQADSIDEETL